MVAEPPGGGHRGDISGIVGVCGADYDNGGAPVEDCGGYGLMGCSWEERNRNRAHFVRSFTVNKNNGKDNRTRVPRELLNCLETADNPPINTSQYYDLRNTLRR